MKLELQGQLVVQDAPIYSTSNNGFPEPHAINSSDKVSCSDKEKSNIEELLLTKTLSKERVRSPLPKCCKCHSTRHLLEDCLMWKSTSKAPGQVGNFGTSKCAISCSQDESVEK